MIQIKLPLQYKAYHQWEEQLKDWSVAHRVEFDTSVKEPFLTEGKDRYVGVDAIDAFFDEYKSFRKDWYACKCDAWLED